MKIFWASSYRSCWFRVLNKRTWVKVLHKRISYKCLLEPG